MINMKMICKTYHLLFFPGQPAQIQKKAGLKKDPLQGSSYAQRSSRSQKLIYLIIRKKSKKTALLVSAPFLVRFSIFFP